MTSAKTFSPERLMLIIKRPRISEKATMVAEQGNQIVFEVASDATKPEIKAAVELLWKGKVKVEGVTVSNTRGKEKRYGRFTGRRDSVKKAYVRLSKDSELNFVEGA